MSSIMCNYVQLLCMADIARHLGEASAEYEQWAGHVKDKINLLLWVSHDASRDRANRIPDHIKQAGIDTPFPVRAVDPPIRGGDKDWRSSMLLGRQTLPSQYHHGGIWPFIGGFYVAALVRVGRTGDATRALIELARLNMRGEGATKWQFREWFNA